MKGRDKMKYYVTSIKNNGFEEEFEILVTEDKEAAVKAAKAEQHINERDNNGCTIEIRVYAEDIEDEDCTCFDYNLVEY